MTTMIKYEDMESEVLMHLSADPSSPVTQAALQNAVIQFCNESWIWRHFPDPLDVVIGQSEYELESPANADIARLLMVRHEDKEIASASTDTLLHSVTDTGTPSQYLQVEPELFTLVPIPDRAIAGGMTVVLALQPRRAALGFPKWIAGQYMEVLAAGAAARLMLQPNKPWTDQNTGAMHLKTFSAAIDTARGRAVNGLSRAVLRTTPQH